MDYIIVNPDPSGTITSLGSLGYTLEAAVADLVDNSISAQATKVELTVRWLGGDSWLAVHDNGTGMDEATLTTAMMIAGRGPAAERGDSDLGRFGLGLKTASFSQARQLIVSTRRENKKWLTRTWDLDVVEASGEWRLGTSAPADAEQMLAELRTGKESGTVVLWRGLHRLAPGGTDTVGREIEKYFYREISRVEAHLAMVFHRYLTSRRLVLEINGRRLRGWDPFLSSDSHTQRIPVEDISVAGSVVRVEGFVLPHRRHLSQAKFDAAAGPRGWLDQQGFYVYRRDRLIVAGGWLGISGLKKDERFILARVSVDFPAELDTAWSVDVRKSSATPPTALRRSLERIAKAARDKAGKVLTHRGQVSAMAHAADFQYAWKVTRHDGTVRCRVNRDHPLIRQLLQASGSESDPIKAMLRLLEQTVPIGALRVLHEAETIDDPEPFTDTTTAEAESVAEQIFEAMLSQGAAPGEARARLRLMPPFDILDGFWHK